MNEGVLKTENNGSESLASDVIFVSGNAREGWALSPLGLLFFGIGLGLLIIDALQRKRKSSAI